MNTHATALFPAHSKPLARCIAALFGLSAPAAMAVNVWPVTSCNDDADPHTLRNVIGAASTLSGDIVDLSGLSCAGGKILLYAGNPGIHIAQNSLTISGPGADYLAVDGSQLDPSTYSAFYHTGSGTLKIQYLTVTSGNVNRQGYALGGCIYSKANVTLVNAKVTACKATGDGARGGGVWAGGDVTLSDYSLVSGNAADAPNGAAGGGIWANGNVSVKSSTVSGNTVSSPGAVLGGGVRANGDVYLGASTISGNSVNSPAGKASGGGLSLAGNIFSSSSTIQDNSATSGGPTAIAGGIYVTGHANFMSSTISGNTVSSYGLRCAYGIYPYIVYFACGGSASGGGAYAAADFSSSHSTISNNSVLSQYGAASGGALAAMGSVMLLSGSLITTNYAGSKHAYAITGGGVYTASSLSLQFSALTDNLLKGGGELPSGGCPVVTGGGATVKGGFQATHATISNNVALPTGAGGGLDLRGFENSFVVSTISGNFVGGNCGTGTYGQSSSAGGVFVRSAGAGSTTRFYNTTIAFNSSTYDPPGVDLVGPMAVTLQSTLMSNNTGGFYGYDLGVSGSVTFNSGDLTAPANNLIRVPSLWMTSLPTDTLTGSCPLLGPLRNNGGPTMTHALLSGSPAIDEGNNIMNLDEDQRGVAADTPPYPYPRVSGSKADIGAYEVQQDDVIFNAGFDGC